jgi:hypothetical protein
MSSTRDNGQPNRAQRRAPRAIHGTRLFNGESAESIHAKFGFPPGSKCMGCGNPPGVGGITLRSFLAVPDLKRLDPDGFGIVAEMHPDKLAAMLVMMRGADGKPVPHVRISTVYACKRCAPDAERAAAKGPSYAIVDISRGPGPDKPQSGYTSVADAAVAETVARAVANMGKDGVS